MYCVCLIGVEYQDHRAYLSLVPIYIVTNASQLPKEFLFPSGAKQLVVGFDCEGIDLGRYGTLCIMQVMIYTRVCQSFELHCVTRQFMFWFSLLIDHSNKVD